MSTEVATNITGRTLDSRLHIIEPIVSGIAVINGLHRISLEHAELVLKALWNEFCGSAHRDISVQAIHERAREEIRKHPLVEHLARFSS